MLGLERNAIGGCEEKGCARRRVVMKDDDGERGLREDRDVDLSLACVTSVLRSAFSLPVGRHDFPQHARH